MIIMEGYSLKRTYECKYAGHTFIDVNDTSVTIRRKGMLNFINQGLKGAKSIPFSSISAIQLKKPGVVTSGYIQFSIAGGNESKGGLFDATTDENTVMFADKKTLREMEELKSYIETKISELNNSVVKSNSLTGPEEIKRYKELLDQGILTREEFEKKKNQILNS